MDTLFLSEHTDNKGIYNQGNRSDSYNQRCFEGAVHLILNICQQNRAGEAPMPLRSL